MFWLKWEAALHHSEILTVSGAILLEWVNFQQRKLTITCVGTAVIKVITHTMKGLRWISKNFGSVLKYTIYLFYRKKYLVDVQSWIFSQSTVVVKNKMKENRNSNSATCLQTLEKHSFGVHGDKYYFTSLDYHWIRCDHFLYKVMNLPKSMLPSRVHFIATLVWHRDIVRTWHWIWLTAGIIWHVASGIAKGTSSMHPYYIIHVSLYTCSHRLRDPRIFHQGVRGRCVRLLYCRHINKISIDSWYQRCRLVQGRYNVKYGKRWVDRIYVGTRLLKARSLSAWRLNHGQNPSKMVSREADGVVRVDVEFKTSYSRFIDVAGRGGKSERRRTRQKVLNYSKF